MQQQRRKMEVWRRSLCTACPEYIFKLSLKIFSRADSIAQRPQCSALMHGKRLRGGDDVTIAQTESSRCWFLLVASGQFGLLTCSMPVLYAQRPQVWPALTATAWSLNKEKLSSISCFLRARCTTHDAHFSREIVILGVPELKKIACGAVGLRRIWAFLVLPLHR